MIPVLLAASGLADGAVQITVDGGGSGALRFFFLLTALTFVPAILLAMTAFTRIVIVLSLLRQALGTPQLPPNQIVVGLSLFLTLFTMSPTLSKVWDEGVAPFLDDQISLQEAMRRSASPMRTFMLRYTREEDLLLFYDVSDRPRPDRAEEIPLSVLVPAYMVSELTTAFRMALFLFVPLVVIDLLLAALLMSLGMMMVPPVLISLPLKIGVFLLADGWHLVLASLARSF